MPDLNFAERHALRVAVDGDIVAAWTNRVLTRLAMRKLLEEHPLRTPTGGLSSSRRFVITDAGRRAAQDAA